MKQNIFNIIFACLLILFGSTGHASAAGQDESFDSIDVSLLTCQPHDEIYSLYGHTALRIQNHTTGADLAINYGCFDPTTKFFVLKFVFGLTDYMMGIYRFSDFLAEYKGFGSGVYQQHISLTREEKIALMKALEVNALPENATYRYNYYYNNCTTRARDLILTAKEGEIEYKPITHLQKGEMSFRDLIHMHTADHPWARLGNDLLLGVGSDINTDHDEREFIPEVLSEDFDSATIIALDGSRRALVDTASWVLLPGKPYHNNGIDFPLTPMQCAIIFLCVILALCIIERFILHRPLPWAHFAVSLLYGISGILLVCMIFSQHPTVSLNLQILIINPLIAVFAFPKTEWYYRWHAILVLCILFFFGNFLQSYAEGMNFMALALSLIAVENIVPMRAK